MAEIGFSTGALFKDQLTPAIALLEQLQVRVVELSALRMRELDGLLAFVQGADFSAFNYVSIHAPTDFRPEQESSVASKLLELTAKKGWSVVVHPDCIFDLGAWKPFGKLLCIENMDKRKSAGRTVEELDLIFAELPSAQLCFDIAHARQVDTTMTEAYRVLVRFAARIVQIHMSEVTSASKHDRISDAAVASFRAVASYLPNVPVILESPVAPESADAELTQAYRVFAAVAASA